MPLYDSLLVIPFYTDPTAVEYEKRVADFQSFAADAKNASGLPLAVIDDGAGLDRAQFGAIADTLIQLPTNMGKSEAIRLGYAALLDTGVRNLIQYDGDGDQSVVDIPELHERLKDVSSSDPTIPTLVIGDRYSELLEVEPNPESVDYRQSILIFFGAIARNLTGAPLVQDWVSGARGLTEAMARELVASGRSSRYGLESEQLVIAGLSKARVATSPLRISRPRDPYTLRNKWQQNFDVYNLHRDALRANGLAHILEVINVLNNHLDEGTPEFELDLTPIGEPVEMSFTRQQTFHGDSYTAILPDDYRKLYFVDTESFHRVHTRVS